MVLHPIGDVAFAGGFSSGVGAALAAGAGLLTWGALAPSSQLFGKTVRRTAGRSSVALTFDDGPNPALTPRLLSLLHEHNVRATFFLIGRFVRDCPALVAEIAAAGHAIGNHTDSHPNLIWLSSTRIADQLNRCQDSIEKACGRRPIWMRPPFGGRAPSLSGVVRRLGFRGVVMWSCWAWDWRPQPIAKLIDRLRPVGGGDIVLLHDGDHRRLRGDRNLTLAALEYWLPIWRQAGLEFVTVDEIASARVVSPMPNAQAARAGGKPGD
jgi:peptidoglycan/xylan/chitin deacetylase (PgdA/CDA1 family)